MSLRIYTNNYSLYLYNDRRALDDADINRLYEPGEGPSQIAKTFYSQYGQDAYVLNTIYNGKSDGTFVDVGANHPTDCNNSYLLELHGWKGLAIEPQKSLNRLWPTIRKTPCLDCVVGAEAREVIFVQGSPEEHGLSGVDGFNKVGRGSATKSHIHQRTLDEILREFGLVEIDYLSIDVEGYEMDVLKGTDFSRVNIRLIGIENDLGFRFLPLIGRRLGFELGDNRIRRFLKHKGYRHIARIVSDDFFVKTGSILGV